MHYRRWPIILVLYSNLRGELEFLGFRIVNNFTLMYIMIHVYSNHSPTFKQIQAGLTCNIVTC